ncbi:MAG: UDP-N-acetylmuramoyl-L-alanine--D-glutamate ligase [Thermodesulfobacteriota bacterium]|nr:UDP-N-acetylmuramoyl-L-alanine--D-glutamate ligase [Thermodesulfobacteriota bacterium]
MNLFKKKVLVVGLGITGVATARFLNKMGAVVTVTDMAEEDELGQHVATIRELGINMKLGSHENRTFENVDMIVLSPGVPHDIPQIQQAKNKGVNVLGEIELASKFIDQPVIAITGTNGKTTTTTLLGEMLKSSGFNVFVGGNIGSPLIGYVDSEKKAEIIVLEVSSFQLDTIESFRPKLSVLLNITEDHLDRYPDFTAYVKSKCRIFENQKAGDTAVLNGGDPLIRKYTKNINSRKLFFTARKNSEAGATINGQNINIYFDGSCTSPIPLSIDLSRTRIRGKHNIENVSAACLAALSEGGTIEGIQTALNRFKGLPHRLEYVATVNGVKYFNDSKATNVDAVTRALECFNDRVILIMGGRNKGADFDLFRDTIRRMTKKIIAIGEAKENIISSFNKVVPVNTALTMEDAVLKARDTAQPGDVVLLSPACSSFDMYHDYGHRGKVFCQAVERLEKGGGKTGDQP